MTTTSFLDRARLGALIIASFVLMAGFGTPSHASLLVNGSFETGDFTGWTVANVNGGSSGVAADGTLIPGVGAPFAPATVNARTGTYAAYAVVKSDGHEYLSLSQSFVAAEDGLYAAGFYMGNESASVVGLYSALLYGDLGLYIDGVHVDFDHLWPPLMSFPNNSTMYGFSGDFTTTAGVHTVEYRISGSGTAEAGFSLDDFYLVQAPAPPMAGIFVLAAAVLAFRARRRA